MSRQEVEIEIPGDLLEFGRELVSGGTYACLDDVVTAALVRFRSLVEQQQREKQRLKTEIQKGLDDLDRGAVSDEDEVFAELEQILGRTPEPAA